MRALILAAGEGTRLRPLTADRPKPMLPIGGRPLLEHLVSLLRQAGIREIAINLHYRPEAIVQHFGDGSAFEVEITYSRERQLLGSAGAVRRLAWFFDRPFMVLYGDVLTDANLAQLVDEHRRRPAEATIALCEVEDPSRCGIAQLEADGSVSSFVEKPARSAPGRHLANAGLYVLQPSVLEVIPASGPADFGRDVFPALLRRRQRINGWRLSSPAIDIGSPERYVEAQDAYRAGRFSRLQDSNREDSQCEQVSLAAPWSRRCC